MISPCRSRPVRTRRQHESPPPPPPSPPPCLCRRCRRRQSPAAQCRTAATTILATAGRNPAAAEGPCGAPRAPHYPLAPTQGAGRPFAPRTNILYHVAPASALAACIVDQRPTHQARGGRPAHGRGRRGCGGVRGAPFVQGGAFGKGLDAASGAGGPRRRRTAVEGYGGHAGVSPVCGRALTTPARSSAMISMAALTCLAPDSASGLSRDGDPTRPSEPGWERAPNAAPTTSGTRSRQHAVGLRASAQPVAGHVARAQDTGSFVAPAHACLRSLALGPTSYHPTAAFRLHIRSVGECQ